MQSQHTVLDTLVYLFDYLVYERKDRPTVAEMNKELGAAGFAQKDIDKAMEWLTHLNDLQDNGVEIKPLSNQHAMRQFSPEECHKISTDGQDFIYKLVEMGILDIAQREIIIDKLMSLDEPEIGEVAVNWVVLMALYNRKGQEANTVYLEQLLIDKKYRQTVH